MSSSNTLAVEQSLDFATVEAAVMETERGRWFLAEFARRQRQSENEAILAVLDNLARRMCAYERFTSEPAAAQVRVPQYDAAEARPGVTHKAPCDLGERLSALREIDALDSHQKVKMFG